MSDELTIFKILIIEDSPTTQEVIKEGAVNVPFPVRFSSCHSGSEAYTYLDRCAEIPEGEDGPDDVDRPDFIVLDMDIPEPHGTKVLEKIKTDDRLKEIPVLINTASDNLQYRMQAKTYKKVFHMNKGLGNGERICELAVKIKNKSF